MRPLRPILPLLLLVACATGRDKILSRTLLGLDAAHAAFLAFPDERYQDEIVDKAKAQGKTKEQAEAALASYRQKWDAVNVAFILAYGGVAACALQPGDASMERLVQLAFEAYQAWQGFAPAGGSP